MMLQQLLSPEAYRAGKAEKLRRQAAAAARRDRERLPLPAWMRVFRSQLVPGRAFDLEEHRYLRAIYADDAPECVYLKAAQVGISEYLISWTLWMAAENEATGFYVMPTDDHVSDFSAARLNPAIAADVSPRLAALIRPAGSKRGADKVTLKRVGDRFVYFRGAHITSVDGRERAGKLKTVDADAVVLDELDEMDPRVEAYARARLEHSRIAQIRIASTPTFADVGIHAAYLRSDQRVWMLRCGACGLRQPLELGRREQPGSLVIEWDALERPLRWHGQADGAPYVACVRCGRRLDRTAEGEWVATYPSRPVHGYAIPGLAAPRKTLAGIIEGLLETDDTKRQQVFNQKLGLTYQSRESEKLSEAVLLRCVRDYGLGPVAGETCYAGIDVGRVNNLVIRGRQPDGNRPLRHAGQYESFDEVARLLRAYNVRAAVVDALPETRAARRLQQAFARLTVWLAYFTASPRGSKTESPAQWDARELAVNLDRTRAIDDAFSRFQNAALRDEDGNPLPGNTLPASARGLPDYFAQLTAPERVKRQDAQGNQVFVYVSGPADHYAMAETYCAMACLCPYQGWARGAG